MKRIATLLGIILITAGSIGEAVAQQSSSSPSTTQPSVLVGSSSLVGSTVRNSEGRDVGKVSQLMIEPSEGRISSVIVSTGGTLGVGSNTISVPWNAVKIGQDQGKVIVTANQTLEPAPKVERPRETQPAATSSEQPQPNKQ